MPTVGVSPGTFTIQLNGAYARVVSPYANEAELTGITLPTRALGMRLDILGAVLGTVMLTGLVVGALASRSGR